MNLVGTYVYNPVCHRGQPNDAVVGSRFSGRDETGA